MKGTRGNERNPEIVRVPPGQRKEKRKEPTIGKKKPKRDRDRNRSRGRTRSGGRSKDRGRTEAEQRQNRGRAEAEAEPNKKFGQQTADSRQYRKQIRFP
jgi:hypothetical protein